MKTSAASTTTAAEADCGGAALAEAIEEPCICSERPDGPIWIVQGVLAAAAAVVGWRAGGTTPRNALAFGAFVVGTLLFLVFVGFTIGEA